MTTKETLKEVVAHLESLQQRIEDMDQKLEQSISDIEEDLFELEQQFEDALQRKDFSSSLVGNIQATLTCLQREFRQMNRYIENEMCECHDQVDTSMKTLIKVTRK